TPAIATPVSKQTTKIEARNSNAGNDQSLLTSPATGRDGGAALEDVERRHIESVLAQTNWMIEGERGAAKILNLNPSTLRSRMQNLGIKRPDRTTQPQTG